MMLYSVNVFLKYHIQQLYYGDIHYVWCSEHFDSTKVAALSPGALVPPTSNPYEIYLDLKKALEKGDNHNYKIVEQRASIKSLAISSNLAGKITDHQRDEIVLLSDYPLSHIWRPLIYVIPKATVDSRLEIVPLAKRSGIGMEYIIKDLQKTEFDIIEP